MLNHINIMGRLVRDAEYRQTNNGTSVASFTIASDRDIKSNDETSADFINVVAWRQTADFVSKYFSKGSMIIVSGRLTSRSYEDKNGNKRTAIEVVADHVYFGDSKRNAEQAPSAEQNDKLAQLAKSPVASVQSAPPAWEDFEDSDLPF